MSKTKFTSIFSAWRKKEIENKNLRYPRNTFWRYLLNILKIRKVFISLGKNARYEIIENKTDELNKINKGENCLWNITIIKKKDKIQLRRNDER